MTVKELEDFFSLEKDNTKLNILLACEESQTVCKQMRLLGHNAFSCDILPTSGDLPEYHIQDDVTKILDLDWDLIIAFPDCTFLTVTGNRWFNVEKYGDKAIQRYKDREEAIKFFKLFADNKCPYIAIENPVGIMSKEYRKPNQIIQPYQFGDPFEKRTCLWLKGLPNLVPTDIVEPPERTQFKSGKTMASWYSDAIKLPKEERSKVRSKTFEGIGKALAEQYINFIINNKQ